MASLSRPLVLAFLAFLAGLLPGLRWGAPPVLFALAAALLIGGILLWRDPSAPRSRRFRSAVVLIAFALAGGAFGGAGHGAAAADCRSTLPNGTQLHVRGVLTASSLPAAAEPGMPPLLPVRVRDLRTVDGTTGRCRGEMRVRLPADSLYIPAGTVVELRAEWMRFALPVAPSAWPRDPRFTGFLLASSATVIAPPSFTAHPLLLMRGRMEAHLQRLFPRHATIAEALLLGRRERVDPALRERFAQAGLSHLLAISGMHVGLIAGVLLLVGRLFRIPLRRLPLVVVGVVLLYLAMIGAPPSAVRAGVMISLVLGGFLLQRPFDPLPVVVAAAFLILAHRPAAVLDPGFQMSFAGVLGILLLRAPIVRRLPTGWRHRRWVRAPVEMAIVSTAAFIATAPVVAWHFGRIAPISVLANFPAIPLMSLGLTGIVTATAIEPVLPPLGRLLADGAGAMLDGLDRVATAAARVPHGSAAVPRPNPWLWAAAALTFLLVVDAAARLRRAARWAVAGGATLSFLLAWPALAGAGRAADPALEIHFLDVGQGDATVIRTPADRWILVDAGPRGDRYDAGERRVLPFLRAQGVHRLELLILTHPHLDHIGGAPAVLRGIPVGRLIEPGLAVGNPVYLETLRAAETRGVPWSAARSGRSIHLDGITLDFLWPDVETLDAVTDANDISAVVRLRYGDFALLLPGDVPAAVEEELVVRHPGALKSQILKAAHHGSRTSSSAALLEAVSPELVVISAARRNRYEHPAPEVLDRLADRGIAVAHTGHEGTLSVRVELRDGVPRWRRLVP
ncbi:hypothetical protein BH23GEM3_BH23GEM3_24390 [soil metagenome]